MAHRHGLAGQYGKTEAAKRKWQVVLGIVGFALYAMLILGFAAGFAWTRFGYWPALFAAFVVMGAVTLAARWVWPYFDTVNRERIKYLRGGQAEALVGWLLEDLDDSWHVFNVVKLELGSDIDHVLVGPKGLFCISTKSHRGLFVGTADGILYNGEKSDFAKRALRQAMDLRDRLLVLMGDDVPWVQSVLAVPLGFVKGNACGGKVWVVHHDDLLERLAPDTPDRKLNKSQIARTVGALELIQSKAASVYERPARSE